MIFDMTRRKNAGGIIVPKTITENGIYLAADDDADGYSQVTVDVWGFPVYNDGNSYIYIAVDDYMRNVGVSIQLKFKGAVTVEWGDGEDTTLTSTSEELGVFGHTYTAKGWYRIKITKANAEDYYYPNANPTNDASNIISKQSGGGGDQYRGHIKFIEWGETITASRGLAAFGGLKGLGEIVLTGDVTALPNNLFLNCSGLTRISVPNTVTSIDYRSLRNMTSLASVQIPASVTSIASQAFGNNTSLREIHFLGSNPPTVANSDAWASLNTNCIIYVPTGSLAAYTSAANYPSSSAYTYVEE